MFTDYLTEQMLTKLENSWAALHFEDPGIIGGVSTELLGASRVPAAMEATGSKVAWNTGPLVWRGLPAGKIAFVALWDRQAEGNLLAYAPLTPAVNMIEGGVFSLNAYELAVSIGAFMETEDSSDIRDMAYDDTLLSRLDLEMQKFEDYKDQLTQQQLEQLQALRRELAKALIIVNGTEIPKPPSNVAIAQDGTISWAHSQGASFYEVNKYVDTWGDDKNVGWADFYNTKDIKPGTKAKARVRAGNVKGISEWAESALVTGKFDGTVECRVLEIKPTSCRIDVNTTKRSADGKTVLTHDYWWDLVTDTGWWLYTDSDAKDLLWTDGVPSNNKSAWCWVLKPDTQYWVKTGVNLAGTWFHSSLQTLKTPKS